MGNELTAICGLDCEKCDARIATVNDDDVLREKTARLWAEWNNEPSITAETINCMGCRADGVKTFFCSDLCEIRQCALEKGYGTCAECLEMCRCAKLAMIASHNEGARQCLSSLRLETERLLLRPWNEQDAERMYELASVPELGERAGWPPHRSKAESSEIIKTVFAHNNTWAIVLKENGDIVGSIGYGPSCDCAIPHAPNEEIVGYWVGKPYWGQGICTEALQLVVRHAFTRSHLPALVSGHFIDNPASGRVMEKCGFQEVAGTVIDKNLHNGNDRPIRVMRLDNSIDIKG